MHGSWNDRRGWWWPKGVPIVVLSLLSSPGASTSISTQLVSAFGRSPAFKHWHPHHKKQMIPRTSSRSPSTCATRRSNACCRPSASRTQLWDISEWRDTMYDVKNENVHRDSFDVSPPREVCILPFPFDEVLLQGETKELRLYEERFISLFDDAMDNYGGVVAMGLLAANGIINTLPLCEIEAYNRMEGFGIFVTIRVVSRAALIDITKETPYIKGVCTELVDAASQEGEDRERLDVIAGIIELMLVTLSSMEHRLREASGGNLGSASTSNENDEDDDDDDHEIELDRTARFRRAFEMAKSTDTQGYIHSASSSDGDDSTQRSVQDLAAISWAAFQTDRLHEDDSRGGGMIREDGQVVASLEVIFRMQASACVNLADRMKLALEYLQKKKAELKESLEKDGIKYDDGMDKPWWKDD
mmetsp:Transcript_5199/g.10999  ORF Transcript_5199/g.10999 Transcript_5199/m.10999 type:complete len:416 (+) Transcript_5199:393-1640(+)